MRTSCAMMTSSVTPPAEEGAEVDGMVEVGGAAVCIWGYLERSCARLHLTVAVSMAHIYEKWGDMGKETKKWRRSLVIAEGKMSLSRVVVSLNTSMRKSIKCEGKSIVRPSMRDSKN